MIHLNAVFMKNITKRFGKFTALNSVNLKIKKGTIHALLGENGAGKSTLMNILYGIYNPDEGEIFINDRLESIKNPTKAIELGIGMVHQHFMLVDCMTVLENIMLGKEEVKNILGTLDKNKVRNQISELTKKYGLHLDLDAYVSDISVGMQQRLEIIKTLYRGSDIIILDEPTAVLTPQEIEELINIMKNLIKDGKTIIIITHKLSEIKQVADECTIIRRGEYIDTVNVSDVTPIELANMMVGREVVLHIDKQKSNRQKVIFKIKDLVVKDDRGIEKIKGLNLEVREGEIYGIAGIDGNGQKELIEAITNLTKSKDGTITIDDIVINNFTTKKTIKSGVSTIHEDRHKRGLVLDFPVDFNAVIEDFDKKTYSKNGFLKFDNIYNQAKKLIKDFDIRPAGCEKTPIRALSGGNQQKLIIAREVDSNPKLLIAMQPTRGLDVGAIEFVQQALIKQRDNGKAVLLVSFELDEILDLSDKIGVIYDGKIVKEFDNEDEKPNKQDLGIYMAGGEPNYE